MHNKNIPHIGDHYYHYKHNPAKGVNHYRYTITDIVYDTVIDELSVVYAPCYDDAFLATTSASYYTRALSHFTQEVTWPDGIQRQRFVRVGE